MRKKIAIFITCLVLPLNVAHADSIISTDDLCYKDASTGNCLIGENDGCYYDSFLNMCLKCKNGWYGTSGKCEQCPTDYPNTNREGEAKATDVSDCYKDCPTTSVTYGTRGPCSPEDSKAYNGRDCNLCLTCNTGTVNPDGKPLTNVCDSYFESNGSCEKRWTTTRPPEAEIDIDCNEGATTKYYLRNDNGKFNCYANGCEDSDVYEFVITDTATNGGFVCYPEGQLKNLGQCMRKNIKCSDVSEVRLACEGWQQDAELSDDDAIYNKETGEYDYHDCKCTTNDKYPIPIMSNNEQIGKQKVQCSYDTVTGFNNETCKTVQVVECIERYCVPVTNPPTTTCVPTLAGYYSTDRSTTCDACPAGTTSSGKNAGKNECGIKRGTDGTKFCDSVGCFTLPPPPAKGDEIIKFGDKTN